MLQEPAIETLKEVETFLRANPSEIVTIILEDYVQTPNGLSNLLKAAGLTKYLFPSTKMPKNGGDWPLVKDMIAQNQRLLVFTSKKSKEKSEGIAYQWNYMVENKCTINIFILSKLHKISIYFMKITQNTYVLSYNQMGTMG